MKSFLFHCWVAVAAIALCAACSEDAELGNDTLAKPQPLVFVATQEALTATSETRAAVDDTWEGGEEIAIQIGDDVKKYKVSSDDKSTLEPSDSDNTFYRTNTGNISITAWYPYSDTKPEAPTISTDQSESTDLESSNLMTATATAVYGKSTTTLAFSHEAARLRFHFYEENTTDTPLTGATVKVTVGTTPTTYTAHEDGNGYYSVLVASGTTISKNADFLSITVSGSGTYKSAAPADVTFKAGKRYDYSFDLGRTPYVTFSATSELKFKMTLPEKTIENLGTFEYSVGGGAWTTVTFGEEVTFGGDNKDLRLRGKSEVGTAGIVTSDSEVGDVSVVGCTISFAGETESGADVAASGDIRTLVDYEKFSTVSTANARFAYLFKDCTVLTSAPELPATTLATSCYAGMFLGCTVLTSAPDLPATELASYCYQQMFLDCTSLTKAPELPATTLATSCYAGMFSYCKALETAPELPATTLATSCYVGMFGGCSKLNKVVIRAEDTIPSDALTYWLAEVASLGTIYKSTSLTLTENNTSGIPSGWTAKDLTEL